MSTSKPKHPRSHTTGHGHSQSPAHTPVIQSKSKEKSVSPKAETLVTVIIPQPSTQNATETPDETIQSTYSGNEANIEEIQPIVEKSLTGTIPPARLFILILISTALISFAGIGGFLYLSKNDKPVQTERPDNQTAATLPSTTPTPSFDPKSVSFEVLNGSGVAGSASQAAQKLQTLGFPVPIIGNADRSNYKQSELILSDSIISKSEDLLMFIDDSFSIASVSSGLLDSTVSARLIIGKE